MRVAPDSWIAVEGPGRLYTRLELHSTLIPLTGCQRNKITLEVSAIWFNPLNKKLCLHLNLN